MLKYKVLFGMLAIVVLSYVWVLSDSNRLQDQAPPLPVYENPGPPAPAQSVKGDVDIGVITNRVVTRTITNYFAGTTRRIGEVPVVMFGSTNYIGYYEQSGQVMSVTIVLLNVNGTNLEHLIGPYQRLGSVYRAVRFEGTNMIVLACYSNPTNYISPNWRQPPAWPLDLPIYGK